MKTLASMLLLCGSTAALAHVAAEPAASLQDMTLNNETLSNDTMTNDTTTADNTTTDTTTPESTTTMDSAANSTDDAPPNATF